MGRISHGHGERRETLNTKLCSSLGLDHQPADLNVRIRQDGF